MDDRSWRWVDATLLGEEPCCLCGRPVGMNRHGDGICDSCLADEDRAGPDVLVRLADARRKTEAETVAALAAVDAALEMEVVGL